MDKLFFGAKKPRSRHSPVRRTRRTPRRKTTMCNKKLSLPKLRKLAVENGVNIFSEKKTSISKRTGMPKKPKMVGCSTLMKRLNEAGLSHLYKIRKYSKPTELSMEEQPEPQELFMEEDISQHLNPLSPLDSPVEESEESENIDIKNKGRNFDPNDIVHQMDYGMRYISGARPKKTQKHVSSIVVKGRKYHVFKGTEGGLYYLKGKTGRKVYIDKSRLKKRRSRFGEEDEEEMKFGRRYMSGARPKKTQKHVGSIVVKGRKHHVFKGTSGGLYYLKGKTGRKVYIDMSRLKKK